MKIITSVTFTIDNKEITEEEAIEYIRKREAREKTERETAIIGRFKVEKK